MSGKVNQVIFQEGLDDEFRHQYSYDGDNKLTQVHTSLDGVYWTLEAKYFYYAHGPLARVEIGEHNIQGVDYYYTLQGWIKGVNTPEGTFGKDGTEANPTFNTDEFAYTLHYFEGDYQARGTSANPNNSIFGNAFNTDEDYSLFTGFYDQTELSGGSVNGIPLTDSYDRKSLYNGNVAAMTTSIAHFGRQEDGNGRATQSMNYRYDQLHRIAAASSKQWNPATGVWESQTLGKAYQTSYQYDRNGNIQKLFRKNQAGQVIDNLRYSYDPVKKNQLYRVTDQAANVDNADFSANGLNYGNHLYEYDEIGNLIKNGSDGIKTIIWNIQGKVEKVVRTNATITYRYDASGNRIIKQVATTTTNHTNFYLRDASGNVLAIYEKKTDQTLAIKEIPIYGGSRLGQYRPKTDTKKTALGQRIYEFSNHLGNVLVTLTDNKVPQTDGTYESVVLSASDYYPFGMAMKERTYSNSEYRYGFNGQEKSDELDANGNSYTAEFWQYDSRIARRWNLDPVVVEWESGYVVFRNSPISLNDPNGDCSGNCDDVKKHKTEKGDTYGALSKKYGVSVDQLRKWNKYEDTKIPVGVELIVSDPTKNTVTAQELFDLKGNGTVSIDFGIADGFEKVQMNYVSDQDVKKQEFLDLTLITFNILDFGYFLTIPHLPTVSRTRPPFAANDLGISVKTNSSGVIEQQIPLGTRTTNFFRLQTKIEDGLIKEFVDGKWIPMNNPTSNLGHVTHRNFVITMNGELRIGRGHYYLSGRSPKVLAAGDIRIINGKITRMTNASGHYLPNLAQSKMMEFYIRRLGVTIKNLETKYHPHTR